MKDPGESHTLGVSAPVFAAASGAGKVQQAVEARGVPLPRAFHLPGTDVVLRRY